MCLIGLLFVVGWFWAVKCVVGTLDIGIVEVALFVGTTAKISLKILVGGQKVEVPFVQLAVQFAHIFGNLFYFVHVADALAIRWVADVYAKTAFCNKLVGIAQVELDILIYTRLLCVEVGNFNCLGVDITAVNIRLLVKSRPSAPSSRARSKMPLGAHFQCWKSKERCSPGGIVKAYSAASMGRVPLPQNRSANGFSG